MQKYIRKIVWGSTCLDTHVRSVFISKVSKCGSAWWIHHQSTPARSSAQPTTMPGRTRRYPGGDGARGPRGPVMYQSFMKISACLKRAQMVNSVTLGLIHQQYLFMPVPRASICNNHYEGSSPESRFHAQGFVRVLLESSTSIRLARVITVWALHFPFTHPDPLPCRARIDYRIGNWMSFFRPPTSFRWFQAYQLG